MNTSIGSVDEDPPAGAADAIQVQVLNESANLTLVYLPGMHGDWTLNRCFRRALGTRVRLVEITYPRTCDWSLAQYGRAVEQDLLQRGIRQGWILAESFSSQVAWQWLGDRAAREASSAEQSPDNSFRIDGLILAGGFVRHPFPLEVQAGRWMNRHVPRLFHRGSMGVVALIARLRCARDPEALLGIREFLVRRTEADQRAIAHRFNLMMENDLRPVARAMKLPVYSLVALTDITVPWPWVTRWLKKNCSGYRETRVLGWASHNVLCSSARASADQILSWMKAG